MKLHTILLYIALAAISVVVHDYFLDYRFPDAVREIHEQVINSKAPAPIQYRVMTYQIAQLIVDIGLSVRYAHFFVRFLFTALCGIFLHLFLRKWFTETLTLAGVLLFYAVLPLTYLWYINQPMDLPNLFFFIVGYMLIRDRKDWYLLPLLLVAMFNRETPILLILVFLLYRLDEIELKELLVKLAGLVIVGFGVYAGLRRYFGVQEYYSEIYYLTTNIYDTRSWLYAALLFNIFLYFAWKNGGTKPKFLKRAALMIPFFIIIHYSMTIMREARLWLPVFPLILPLGLMSLFPGEVTAKKEQLPSAKNILSKLPAPAMYVAMVSGFIIFFVFFFNIYTSQHLKEAAKHKQAAAFMASAENNLRMNLYTEAVAALNQALALNPQETEAHYRLARIYNYYLYNKEKALEEYNAVLTLNPFHQDKNLINWEIKRLEAMK